MAVHSKFNVIVYCFFANPPIRAKNHTSFARRNFTLTVEKSGSRDRDMLFF